MPLIEVDTSDLHVLSAKLAAVEPKMRVLLRRELVKSGSGAKDAIAAEASWSSRIPGSLRVKVSFAARGAGISVAANQKKAPEARVLEHGGKPGQFSHPVFAHGSRSQWGWAKENARPFFEKGAEKFERGKFQVQVEAISEEVAVLAGFH